MAHIIEINGVYQDVNNPNIEIVKLTVVGLIDRTKTFNLQNYAVLDNTYNSGSLSNLNVHIFRFPNQVVKANDVIHLHTGIGTNYAIAIANTENMDYHFFTQTPQPHWNNTGDRITVINYIQCDSKPLAAIV
jgi:hypothetical protein